MKTRVDLVRGWLRKAQSDLTAAEMCLEAGQALDAACFHAQQAAEKSIKAYLAAHDIEFPFIHNLEKLIELCAQHDSAFAQLKTAAQELTPYAVELRYDDDFWPAAHTARQAYDTAVVIRELVITKLPPDMKPE